MNRKLLLSCVVALTVGALPVAGLGGVAAAAPPAPAWTAYVANLNDDTVTPINTATNTAGTPIAVGDAPAAIAITPDGATAYVVNQGSSSLVNGSVTPINTATNTPGTAIPVGKNPTAIAITPDGTKAYVANEGDGNITPIDVVTNTAGPAFPCHDAVNLCDPTAISFTPDGSTAWVSNNGSNQVIPIDVASNTLRPGFTTAGHVISSAIAPDGSILYAPNFTFGSVTRNDLATQTQLAPIQGFGPGYNLPFGVAVSPDNHWVYWSDGQAIGIHDVTDPNGAKVITSIGACCQIHGIALTPDGNTLYVANSGDGTVTPFDTATKTLGTPIHVGSSPWAIAITPDQAPVARLSVTRAPIGSPTTFDASASTVKYGTIASYAWDFGDGTTDVTTTPTTQHTYTGGSYTASVVEMSSGGTSSARVFTGQTALRNGGLQTGATALGSLADLGAPVVWQVTPATGLVAGGTAVNIIGSGFTGATAVTFGGVPATAVTLNGDNSISATTPAAAGPATVDVQVTNSKGVSAASPADRFRYLGTVPAVTNSCTNSFSAVAFGTTDMSVAASTTNPCIVCNFSGGIAPQPVPSKCGYGNADLVPAGYVQATQNQGTLSFIAMAVQYQNLLADIYSSGDKAAQQLVEVCYQDGTPHIVSAARAAATTTSATTTAAPKAFLLKDCVKTKNVPPCVAARSIVNGVVHMTLHVPASGATVQVMSPPVVIKKLTPVFGLPSASIVISGTNMNGVVGAVIGGVRAPITSRDAKSVTVTIPDGARSGRVTLLTNDGPVTSPKPLAVGPTITKITPTGKVGAKVAIKGYLLGTPTDVSFNGASATIVSATDTVVVATVPAGATAGPITVTTPAGTAVSPTVFTPKP